MQCSTEKPIEVARKIAVEVAAKHAQSVDAEARFPQECIDALRSAGLLSAPIPRELGGAGLNLQELAQVCAALGAQCGASAMVLAMHYSQLACLTRHIGDSEPVRSFLRDLVQHQYLLASMTSEEGTFGATRTSICAVEIDGEVFRLSKRATTGSYCAHADAILITCRRNVDASASDQVLVLARKGQYQLEQTSDWDTLGMRGTCSPGFSIVATGPAWQVLATPFVESSAESMVPYSHVLWAALWTGLAHGALQRAATQVRAAARKTPGQAPRTATLLAAAAADLQQMRRMWQGVAADFDALDGRREPLRGMQWALNFNQLKVKSSEAATRVVHQALQILGIPGYQNNSPVSVGRHYRDVLSASLMISNERIQSASADILLALKDF